jgi:dGTPase
VRADASSVARRFLDRTQPSLEAQLCNLADEIAYNAHDIDDGVRSGLLSLEQLGEVELAVRFRDAALRDFPLLAGRRLLFETIRRMLSAQVYDVIEATSATLAERRPASADAARQLPVLVRFGDTMVSQSAQLKAFLRANLYRHPRVVQTTGLAKQVIRDLFAAYCNDASQLPPEHALSAVGPRGVADYIAGMTDRFALREHERITGQRLFP